MDALNVAVSRAAVRGELAEVERVMVERPSLLHTTNHVFGWTPLMFASQGGHLHVVHWLLEQGVAVDALSGFGQTALWFACRKGRPAVVRLLMERGADPTIGWGEGSIPFLTAASSLGHIEVVRLLLGHPGVKEGINHRDDEGRTALRGACYWGRGRVVRVLLKSGADPSIADNDGDTPMDIARQMGRRECVAALLVRLCVAPPRLEGLLC
jgi:ankyrin repeat protein